MKALWSLALLLLAAPALYAQEPGLYEGKQVVQFRERPGYIHVILPCDGGLCWPVRAKSLDKVNGHIKDSELVNGVIHVTQAAVVFEPATAADAAIFPKRSFPRDAVRFQQAVGKPNAVLFIGNTGLQFGFKDICVGCKDGDQPIDLTDKTEIDLEYATLHKAVNDLNQELREFEATAKRPLPGVLGGLPVPARP